MVRIQLYIFTQNSILGIQLRVSALYIGHRQVTIQYVRGVLWEGVTRSRFTIVGGMALGYYGPVLI